MQERAAVGEAAEIATAITLSKELCCGGHREVS